MEKGDVFDLFGLAVLLLFAYSIDPRLTLLVMGGAFVLAGHQAHRAVRKDRDE